MSRRRKWALVAALLAGSGFAFGDGGGPVTVRAAETKDGKVYTQAVEVLSATNRAADGSLVPADSPAPEKPAVSKPNVKAPTEPPPTTYWIWGADQNEKYVLRKQFEGRAKVARLKAACDNIMSVSVNGQAVASGSSWQDPVTVDVSSKLTDGLNTISVEVTNQGGPAGFTLRLALTGDDGKIRYVVTDDSWEAANAKSPDKFVPVKRVAKIGDEPWGDVYSGAAGQGATANLFNLLPGFQVERIFTVPKDELGSWVAITTDDRGRLIASDQGDKGLFRITPPKAGSGEPTKVERLNVRLSSAQGLLHAFGALYVSVNGGPGSGLYRVKDTDGDDQYDELVKLKDFRGGGEHGPHALTLSPDGQSIFVSCGNHTLPPFDPKDPPKAEHTSRIPTNWDEDHLLPRQWDANGHARGILAPGGWLAKTDPDGKTWEVFSIGYRNQYDLAFNADGELFSYDADMEWDMGSPWYRPTRVVHATSGSEFGWRSGTGKWPPYYVDSLPQLIDIGPGSPVGIAFGYGAKFPAKYQHALYICDWTFGTMYAIHMEPDGASYRAVKEEFVSRTPLPLTDVTVAQDGALYFSVGGRGTQSEIFRVTYVGKEPTTPVSGKQAKDSELRALRRKLESYHRKHDQHAEAIKVAYPQLGHADRHVRYAARVALEFVPAEQWQDKVLSESNVDALITGAVGLARQGDKSLKPRLLAALDKVEFAKLSEFQQLSLLRAYQLIFIRQGEPEEATRAKLAAKLDAFFPAKSDGLNKELANLLVYLRAPGIAGKIVDLLQKEPRHDAPDMAELLARNRGYGGSIAAMLANHPDLMQVHYAFALRNLKEGWTLDQRKAYFQWFEKAQKWSGGASYKGFLRNIDQDAYDNASDKERLAIEAFGARKPYTAPALPKPTGPGREWTTSDVVAAAQSGLAKGRNFKNGEKAFAAARCVLCHRFAGDGGATGPDLTQLAGRFNVKDLTESIVEPSKVVSDQYRAMVVETSSGKSYSGRIVAEGRDELTILTNPEDATKVVHVKKTEVEQLKPSAVSLMPQDLLKPLNQDEVLDLLAYLLSRGNPSDPMFRK